MYTDDWQPGTRIAVGMGIFGVVILAAFLVPLLVRPDTEPLPDDLRGVPSVDAWCAEWQGLTLALAAGESADPNDVATAADEVEAAGQPVEMSDQARAGLAHQLAAVRGEGGGTADPDADLAFDVFLRQYCA